MKVVPKQRLVKKGDVGPPRPFVSSTIMELQEEYDDGLIDLDIEEAPTISTQPCSCGEACVLKKGGNALNVFPQSAGWPKPHQPLRAELGATLPRQERLRPHPRPKRSQPRLGPRRPAPPGWTRAGAHLACRTSGDW
jgi:hypothetical protein